MSVKEYLVNHVERRLHPMVKKIFPNRDILCVSFSQELTYSSTNELSKCNENAGKNKIFKIEIKIQFSRQLPIKKQKYVHS